MHVIVFEILRTGIVVCFYKCYKSKSIICELSYDYEVNPSLIVLSQSFVQPSGLDKIPFRGKDFIPLVVCQNLCRFPRSAFRLLSRLESLSWQLIASIWLNIGVNALDEALSL